MKPKIFANIIFSLFGVFALVYKSKAQLYPDNFTQTSIITGLNTPTAMAFAPDGRMFVCQQDGNLKIIKNGVLLATPAITLSVNSTGERGLLGIAFDPNFATNNLIYLYYTTFTAPIHNRVSRFTILGDIVSAGSEIALLELDNLSSATNHNGGGLQFGPDGKLYIAVGDNANGVNSQLLSNYLGKILRINTDGSSVSDNPFIMSMLESEKRIWSFGLRNPYTIAFQPGTGILFSNEVGQNTWEEINEHTLKGLNYGWPNAEGNSSNTNYTNPIYFYGHSSNTIGQGCAITGGTFLNSTAVAYPAQYIGNYFFMDYCGGWIDRLILDPPVVAKAKFGVNTYTRAAFGSGISGNPLALTTGPDGNLYFLVRRGAINTSSLEKIAFTGALAVKLTNFVAKLLNNNEVEVSWQTTMETNAEKFDIQKSIDSKIWETIGSEKAVGESIEILNYRFIDKDIANGISYYRLKMIATDGAVEYSLIKAIQKNVLNQIGGIYPNPAADILNINDIDFEENNFSIYTVNGQEMTQFTIKNDNQKTINLGKLPKGKYFIKTKSGSKAFIKN
jgi:glucose/arabinose dehydrogenase